MFKFAAKMKRPLLAAALAATVGMGAASAIDVCDPCSAPVVVYREVEPVVVYREVVPVCDPCATPVRRVRRVRRVYRSAPVYSYPVVYREMVSAPVYREVVTSTPVYTCTACE